MSVKPTEKIYERAVVVDAEFKETEQDHSLE